MKAHAARRPEPREPDLIFCATGKSGLGHLRRITNIVTALAKLRPGLSLHLVSNASIEGLSADEADYFEAVHTAARLDMASAVASMRRAPVIVDTAILPGLEALGSPLCLILRETVAERIRDFKLPGSRKWDLVCVPNPADHWLPNASSIGAKRIAAVGWIFRKTTASDTIRPRIVSSARSILVASGGGGNAETSAWFKREMDGVIKQARALSTESFWVIQVAGPRLPDNALLSEADDYIDVGSHLNEQFPRHDLVISTVGYNSALELAQLDVPVLLVPIARSLDDQIARAEGWAGRIGYAHVESDFNASAQWICSTLKYGKRRMPCKLDDGGAATCAARILELLP